MTRAFSIFAVKSANGSKFPVVVLEENDTCIIDLGIVNYIRFLSNRGDSFAKMNAACRALGNLFDFYVHVYGGAIIPVTLIATIIARFLWARRNGTIDRDGNDSTGLRWHPVSRQTVSKDRYYIAEYSDFCVTNSGTLPLGPTVCPSDKFRQALEKINWGHGKPKPGDLLHHIAHYRKGQPSFGIDLAEPLITRNRGSRSKHFPTLDVVDQMIAKTDSIVQKMLLIEAFFGGPRLSEMLHQWRCDVLPGRLRKSLFPDDVGSSIPLVILAHPSQSTFHAEKDLSGSDRSMVLKAKYGLSPRHLIKPDPLWIGWKGMQFDEMNRLVSQVFWSDLGRAHEFYELYNRLRTEIYPMVPSHILASHPYLFINDCPNTKHFGLPMKLSNARKVFARACARIGLDPQRFKDGSHGSRHTYKATLKSRLKLSSSHIQKCMHHLSESSQEEYGKDLKELQLALNGALQPRGLEDQK